jgi:hypothetical protein
MLNMVEVVGRLEWKEQVGLGYKWMELIIEKVDNSITQKVFFFILFRHLYLASYQLATLNHNTNSLITIFNQDWFLNLLKNHTLSHLKNHLI